MGGTYKVKTSTLFFIRSFTKNELKFGFIYVNLKINLKVVIVSIFI